MRFCYADPPYPGQAKRYRQDPNHAEVDPVALMARLEEEFPDGWAMSSSSPALREIVPAMPKKARIAVWCKPFVRIPINIWPAYSFEPVIVRPGRCDRGAHRDTPFDHLVCGATWRNFMGAKPPEFCYWVFDMLGARREDELVDLFPGTGGVTQAWRFYREALAPIVVRSGQMEIGDEMPAGRCETA